MEDNGAAIQLDGIGQRHCFSAFNADDIAAMHRST
jgi:hypothetical protein